jgi:hypothetical protein
VATAHLAYEPFGPFPDRCVPQRRCRASTTRRATSTGLKTNAQIRSPLWIAHTQHDYARMLLARGQPHDNDNALELLKQPLTTAEHLG